MKGLSKGAKSQGSLQASATLRPSSAAAAAARGDVGDWGPQSSNPRDEAVWALHHAKQREDVGQLTDAILEAAALVPQRNYALPVASAGELKRDGFTFVTGRTPSSPSSRKAGAGQRYKGVAVGQQEVHDDLEVSLRDARQVLRGCRSNLAYKVVQSLREDDCHKVAGDLYDGHRACFGAGLMKLLEQRLAWMHNNKELTPTGATPGRTFASPLRSTKQRTSRKKQAVRSDPVDDPVDIVECEHSVQIPRPMFPGARPEARPSQKDMDKMERALVLEIFQRYDRDGSDEIDLQELHSMLADLGVELGEDECQSAMQELDVGGNGHCCFDEFLEWWSSKAEERTVGQSVTLAFMKGKFMTEIAFRKARVELARAGADMEAMPTDMCDEDVMSIGGSLSLSSHASGCPEGMSASATMEPVKEGSHWEFDEVTVTLRTKSEPKARRVCDKFQELIKLLKWDQFVGVSLNGVKAELKFKLSPAVVEWLQHEESQAESNFKKKLIAAIRMQVIFGANFEDLVSSPEIGLAQKIAGIRLSFDYMFQRAPLHLIPKLVFGAEGDEVPTITSCISGLDFDFQIGYDNEHVQEAMEALANACGDMFGEQIAGLIPKSLSEQREALVNVIQDNVSKDNFIQLCEIAHIIQYLNNNVTCLDYLRFTGLPGYSQILSCSFQDCNPFTLAAFVLEPLVANCRQAEVSEPSTHFCKSLSSEEQTRLHATFDTYDRDGNGSIDLHELQQLCQDLGGKLSHTEAHEAMEQLDTDGNGKCDFDDFVHFWTSKPNLGGYSSIALKFMKLKLAAGSLLGNGMQLAKSARRSIKALLEFRPSLNALEPAMSMTCSLRTSASSSLPAEGEVVKVILRLTVSSTLVVKAIEELISEFGSSLSPFTIAVEEDASTVCLSIGASVEALTAMIGADDLRFVVSLAVQCLTNVGVQCAFGSTFENCVNYPDTPLHQLLGGAQFTFSSSLSERVSTAFESAKGWLPSMHSFAVKLFAGCDLSCRLRYNESKIAKMLEMMGVTTPDGSDIGPTLNHLKTLVGTLLPHEPPAEGSPHAEAKAEPPDLASKISDTKRLLEGLQAVESITFQNFMLLSADNLHDDRKKGDVPTSVELVAKFDNFNPFCLIGYVL